MVVGEIKIGRAIVDSPCVDPQSNERLRDPKSVSRERRLPDCILPHDKLPNDGFSEDLYVLRPKPESGKKGKDLDIIWLHLKNEHYEWLKPMKESPSS